MRLDAVITFPGDIDLIGPDAEPEPGKLVLKGTAVSGAEVWANGHRIGTALAVDRQDFDKVYADDAAPYGSLIHWTHLAMRLEVPLP